MCTDPRCENGTITGGEYVTASGEVDYYTYACHECECQGDDYVPF